MLEENESLKRTSSFQYYSVHIIVMRHEKALRFWMPSKIRASYWVHILFDLLNYFIPYSVTVIVSHALREVERNDDPKDFLI